MVDSVLPMIKGAFPIQQESLQNPYKEFIRTIPPNGGRAIIFYNFSYWRILEINSVTGLSLRFGGSGDFTSLVGAGIGANLPYVTDRIELINTSTAAITVTLALMVGQINDDRLNVTGTVATSPVKASSSISENPQSDITGTATLLSSGNPNTTIVIVQNNSTDVLGFLGSSATDTFNESIKIAPGQSLILDNALTSDVYGISNGATITSTDISTMRLLT